MLVPIAVCETVILAYEKTLKSSRIRSPMRRRNFVRASGVFVTVGVAGCLNDDENENGDDTNGDENGNGNGNDENGNGENGDADDVGRTDTGESGGFSWEFEVTRLEAGNVVDEADIDFDHDGDRVVVTGTTYGGNLCKTAELDSATVSTDDGDTELDVSITTRDVEGAGDVCAEAIREIDYVATFDFDDELPNSVRVRHDDRSVTGAAWDSDTESPDDA